MAAKNMFQESDFSKIDNMGFRDALSALSALSRGEPIPRPAAMPTRGPSPFGAMSPFGNTPSFGNGGFPDFDQWLQTRYRQSSPTIERAGREEQRRDWRDTVLNSSTTVTPFPVAGPLGNKGKVVGFD